MICNRCNFEFNNGNFCSNCGAKQGFTEISLSEIYEEWCEFYKNRISSKTWGNYKAAWKVLLPICLLPYSQLRTKAYQQIIDSFSDKYSLSQLEKIKQLCCHLNKFALMEDIVKISYASFIYLGNRKKSSKPIFSINEILQLHKYASEKNNEYWYDARMVLTLIFTGMRPSELFNLEKENVNIKQNYIIGGSKTTAGKNRLMPISQIILPFIAEWYSRCPSKPSNSPNYLVRSQRGKKIDLNHWRNRRFYPLMIELGSNTIDCPPILKPRCGRHTFASLSNRAEMKPEILTKIIGHTDFAFTNQTYIHQNLEEYQTEIQKVEDLYYSKQHM